MALSGGGLLELRWLVVAVGQTGAGRSGLQSSVPWGEWREGGRQSMYAPLRCELQ